MHEEMEAPRPHLDPFRRGIAPLRDRSAEATCPAGALSAWVSLSARTTEAEKPLAGRTVRPSLAARPSWQVGEVPLGRGC
jgi:hypothetical protein